MDFLIARLPNVRQAQQLESNGLWTALSVVEGGPVATRHENYLVVAPEGVVELRSRTLLFDGHVTFNGAALSSAEQGSLCQATLQKLVDYSGERKGRLHGISGVYVLAQLDFEAGQIDIVCDPLSQYNLFSAVHAGITVFSNNIYYIEELFAQLGQPLERSFSVMGHEASLGYGAGLRTGVQGVSLSPIDHSIRIHLRNGMIEYQQCGNFAEKSGVQGATHTAAESLADSVRAVHTSFPDHDIVYDLTGGFDSRIVFAASHRAGLRNQLIFRSDGAPAYDIQIPDYIAQQYGLKYAPFPQNFDGEQMTPLDFARRAVFRQQGQSTIYNFELGRHQVSGVCRMRGGVGEIARAVYNRRFNKSARWYRKQILMAVWTRDFKSLRYVSGGVRGLKLPSGANTAIIALLLSRGLAEKKAFFTNSFCGAIADNILEQLEALLNAGVEESALLNGLYLIDRSRRHYGFTSQMLNAVRPSFEPLASIDFWHFCAQYDLPQRDNGQAVYDLMGNLEASLLDISYASSPFDRSTLGFKVFSGEYANVAPPEIFPIKSVTPPSFVGGNDEGLQPAFGHAKHVMPHIDLFFELLFSLDRTHEVWRVLRRDTMEALYKNTGRNSVFQANALMFKRLFYGLLWVHRMEQKTPVEFRI